MEPESKNLKRLAPWRLILLIGLVVGSLDISAAFVDYYVRTGKGPKDVLVFIASGVFGTNAFSKNNSMMLWGLAFHFIIAYAFTIVFYWLYPKIKLMSSQIILTSILYGSFIWIVMNLVVLPLSHIPKYYPGFLKAGKDMVILMFTMGLPLSLMMKKYSKNIWQQKVL